MIPFDINAVTLELKAIDTEIGRISKLVTDLKKKKKTLTDKLQLYFNNNQHQGVIINDMTILSVVKSKKKAIPLKEKEEQMKSMLRKYEVPEQVANEIHNITHASKQTTKQEIVIKKEDKKK